MRLNLETLINLCLVSSLAAPTPYNFASGTLTVISEETEEIVRIIQERNIRSMSDHLEGYLVSSNPINACEVPELAPPTSIESNETEIRRKWILLAIILDCDLTTKAKNAQTAGYSGLIVQNIGTNNSHIIPWHIMRFPLARINHVVVGEYDGYLLRYNYSYPDNKYYLKFEEDHFYQILCYFLAGIVLFLLVTMFLVLWFQICCTIVAMRLPHRFSQRFERWVHPGKIRLTRPMLLLIPIKNWVSTDPWMACAICQEDYKDDEKIRILNCSHAFHPDCIDPWLLKRSRRCPNCMQRVKLPTDNDREETEDSEYSPRPHPRRNGSNRRRCSIQPSHNDSRNPSTDVDPLLELSQSPKNRNSLNLHDLKNQTPFHHSDSGEDNSNSNKGKCCLVTITDETSKSQQDWQLKRFQKNFNYVTSADCGGSSHCVTSYCSTSFLPRDPDLSGFEEDEAEREGRVQLFSLKSGEETTKVVEQLLETCLDCPGSVASATRTEESPCGDNVTLIRQLTSLGGLRAFRSSRSVGDDVDTTAGATVATSVGGSKKGLSSSSLGGSLDVTEENNLSSSSDATTISESLPRDESISNCLSNNGREDPNSLSLIDKGGASSSQMIESLGISGANVEDEAGAVGGVDEDKT